MRCSQTHQKLLLVFEGLKGFRTGQVCILGPTPQKMKFSGGFGTKMLLAWGRAPKTPNHSLNDESEALSVLRFGGIDANFPASFFPEGFDGLSLGFVEEVGMGELCVLGVF